MNYRINCSVPNVDVYVDQSNPEEVVINVGVPEYTDLGSCSVGNIVRIGERNYLIVDKNDDDQFLMITTEPVTKMQFGNTRNFLESDIKSFCDTKFTEEYLKNVCSAPLLVTDLQADDGTYFQNIINEDCVNYAAVASIPSTSFYRKYRKTLSAINFQKAATVNAVTATDVNSRSICMIDSCGILGWASYHDVLDVHCVVRAFTTTKVQIITKKNSD